jgi:hypothetical protein
VGHGGVAVPSALAGTMRCIDSSYGRELGQLVQAVRCPPPGAAGRAVPLARLLDQAFPAATSLDLGAADWQVLRQLAADASAGAARPAARLFPRTGARVRVRRRQPAAAAAEQPAAEAEGAGAGYPGRLQRLSLRGARLGDLPAQQRASLFASLAAMPQLQSLDLTQCWLDRGELPSGGHWGR